MTRKQRPMGLTLLLTTIQSKQQLDERTIYQLINYSMNHSLSYNNKPFTIETLAQLLNIPIQQAYKHYLQHSSKLATLINPNDLQGLYLGQIFGSLAKSSETMSQIQNQRRMLQASQNGQYTPFLTEQVNSILNVEMGAHKTMVNIAEGMLKSIDPRALPQSDSGGGEKAIGVQEAMKLLEAQGQLGLTYSKDSNNHLKQQYLLEDIPQVIANLQIGNKEDEALVKMNKNHHKNRRQEEYDLDSEQ